MQCKNTQSFFNFPVFGKRHIGKVVFLAAVYIVLLFDCFILYNSYFVFVKKVY